jgi:hypothetical protein
MECNICQCTNFGDMNSRKFVRCKNCGSLERTRLLWLYMSKLNIKKGSKILHLAPEIGISNKLKDLAGVGYLSADLLPENYSFDPYCRKIDLCDLDSWQSNEFDFIIHCHVLEHIPCNIAYTLYHLHRMLKPNGTHMFVIPFRQGKYDECFQNITAEEKIKRFGQFDHIRSFGKEDFNSHIGKILNLPKAFDALRDFNEDVLINANIPKSLWKGLNMGTVFSLCKMDYKLTAL